MRYVYFDQICIAARSRWVKNGSDARQYEEWYISSDFYHCSSESVNPVLSGAPWNVGCDYSILSIKYYCGCGWPLTEEQRGICCQNVVSVNLPVSRLGSARVNHNAEFYIVGLNQKIPLSPYMSIWYFWEHIKLYQHLPTWVFDISENK